ncbi:ArnT family glycosyltransferase [Polluticoccus soli]|uniref:ArnT family glycosyltransferase n=1 Tax=Polluticoccus soli TaxID=3034150 RepID=UPI0023E0CB26|nr:glycosyltransferase family 39 protein [Flavipsychrobacter sp. JY13-12]
MKISATTGFFILLLIIAYPLFGNLGYYPIRLWDESRVAINAYEMFKTGDWIVTRFDGAPDMWNTKPPLLIWIQVGFIKLLGLNDLAIRIISPIAALFTCIFLYWFFLKKFAQPWLAILVCFVLVTSQGYVRTHGTRTGEYDSLMVMFTTMYVLYYFLFLEDRKTKYLYASLITLTLAVLTKGVAAVIFLPVLFIYTIYRRQLLSILKNGHFYIGISIFLIFGIGYYFLRDHNNPGFIEQVHMNELGGRYMETDHPEFGYSFYWHFLTSRNFIRWLVLMFVGSILAFFSLNRLIRELTIYSALAGGFYFLVVSVGKTKNTWYDMPCYPFFAIITALGIYIICKTILEFPSTKRYLNVGVVTIFLGIISWLPYYEIIKEAIRPDYQDWSQENDSITFYIRDILHGKRNAQGLAIANEGYQADMDWYQLLLAEQNRTIPKIDYKAIPAGQKVIAFQQAVKQYIATHYNTRIIDSFNTLRVYEVNGTN